jgi:hypothetical protein
MLGDQLGGFPGWLQPAVTKMVVKSVDMRDRACNLAVKWKPFSL